MIIRVYASKIQMNRRKEEKNYTKVGIIHLSFKKFII